MDLVTQIIGIVTTFAKLGGGLWAVWGAIVLAGGLKDHNGPDIKAGIWQILGGGVIITATQLFSSLG